MAWTERTPACSVVDKDWRVAATSWDGLAIACAVYGGRLYTSIDGGANWTEEQPAGDALKHWRLHACNASGSLVFAGVNNGRLYATGAPTPPSGQIPVPLNFFLILMQASKPK
jgi:hypothetical protein